MNTLKIHLGNLAKVVTVGMPKGSQIDFESMTLQRIAVGAGLKPAPTEIVGIFEFLNVSSG